MYHKAKYILDYSQCYYTLYTLLLPPFNICNLKTYIPSNTDEEINHPLFHQFLPTLSCTTLWLKKKLKSRESYLRKKREGGH